MILSSHVFHLNLKDFVKLFENWYNTNCSIDLDNKEELKVIIEKINNFQKRCSDRSPRIYDKDYYIISDYMELYIMNMSANQLKEYIIQMTEPKE